MITWHSTRVPVSAMRLGLSSVTLATLTIVAAAQGASSGTAAGGAGGATGAASSQGNVAAGESGQVHGLGSPMQGADVAGTGLGGTSTGSQSPKAGPTSGTGQSVQRPHPAGGGNPQP